MVGFLEAFKNGTRAGGQNEKRRTMEKKTAGVYLRRRTEDTVVELLELMLLPPPMPLP